VAAVTVVVAFVVLAGSLRTSVDRAVRQGFRGDFVVEGSGVGLTGLPVTLAQDLTQRPEVAAAAGFGLVWVQIGGAGTALPAVQGAALAPLFDIDVTAGDVARLDDPMGGLAVQVDRARREGWRLGSGVTVTFPTSGPVTLPVVALYRDGDLAGDLLVGRGVVDARVAGSGDQAVFVQLADGVPQAAARAALSAIVDRYPTARLSDPAEYSRRQQARIDRALVLLLALTGLALVLALVGVANAAALGTLERHRELAVLRANGASVAQLRRMLRWEAVIVALLGAAAGTVLGMASASAILRNVAEGGFRRVTLPAWPLALVAGLALVTAVVAALLPGRRLGRLAVVEALAEE
jgi:putative ABC transport system permease protein